MGSAEGNVDSKLYVDSKFFPRVAERLYEMQRSGTLCDATLISSHPVQSLSFHRCVLAASSPAFCALLDEPPTSGVTLTVGNIAVIESLVEYMYLGRLRVDLASARDLLKLGMNYAIGNVVCLVEQHLSMSLSLSTWVDIFQIAGEFKLASIDQWTAEFLAANVDSILGRNEVEQLDLHVLQRILTDCKVPNGWNWQVPFIMRWCEGAYSERAGRVEELLDLVNFEGLNALSLKLKLENESAKYSHNVLRSVLEDCLSHAADHAVKTDFTNRSANEEINGDTVSTDLHKVSEIDENSAGEFTKVKEIEKLDGDIVSIDLHKVSEIDENSAGGFTQVKEMEKLDGVERPSESDSSKRIVKRQGRSSKRKGRKKQIKARISSESRNVEAVSISSPPQVGDCQEKLIKFSTEESCSSETESVTSVEHLITSSGDTLEAGRTPSSKPSRALQRIQLQSSSDIDSQSICQRPSSVTVSQDGHRKPKRARQKRAKTVDEMYVCSLCPKRFPTYSEQQSHVKGHGSDIPLVCDICGFSTKHRASMNVHKQIHFGKRLKCRYEDCTYSAIRINDLEDHHNAHKGIKSHVCSICGKAFASRRHHLRHEKIHTNPKKYSCSKCKYFTARSDKLLQHERRHHQTKTSTGGKKSKDVLEKTRAGNSKRRRKTSEKQETEETR